MPAIVQSSGARHRMRLVGLFVVAVLVVAGCGSSSPSGTSHSATSMASVRATADFRVPSDPSQVAMFVETGSANEHCLATLSESQLEAPVQELYCAHRTATFDGGAPVEGIWIHVFFAADPGDGMDMWITVLQEGATSYGMPRYCFTEQGC